MPTPPKTSSLFAGTLRRLGNQLRERLEETREALDHGGDKGAHAEQALRQAVARYLPRRLTIGQGEVIDTFDRRSGQVDFVVVNEDQPFIFPETEPGLFLIEAVMAAAEVKSVLTGDELNRALVGSRKFKALTATPGIGARVAKPSDIDRFHEHRPHFVFAYESQLSLETIAERVKRFESEAAQDGVTITDAVFILDRGVLLNLGDGHGSIGILRPDGSRHSGWVIHPTDEVMFPLLSWLSMVMPRVQRLTPLLPEYMTHILSAPAG